MKSQHKPKHRSNLQRKILLVGAGELGLEIAKALKIISDGKVYITAIDRYANVPAKDELNEPVDVVMEPWTEEAKLTEILEIIESRNPDIVIPELIATPSGMYKRLEERGYKTIPSARIVESLINRVKFRLFLDLQLNLEFNWRIRHMFESLGVRMPAWAVVAGSKEVFREVSRLGPPCIVKPAITDLGLGQSLVHNAMEAEDAWEAVKRHSRNPAEEQALVEKYVNVRTELFQIVVATDRKPKAYAPIEYRRDCGENRFGGPWQLEEAFQPSALPESVLARCSRASVALWQNFLKEDGFFGFEFLVEDEELFLNEITIRPDDMGFVTLLSQEGFSQFDVFARVILGMPPPRLKNPRATAVCRPILSPRDYKAAKFIWRLENAEQLRRTGVHVFTLDKEVTTPSERVGFILAKGETIESARKKVAQAVAEAEFRIGRDEIEALSRQEEMREQERMGAWKNFSARAAHRVGTVTSDIRGALTWLSDELEAREVRHDVEELLERLEAALHKMQTIVREFADFSRPRQFEFQIVQVNRILERALEEVGLDLRGDLALVCNFCDDLPPVRGDQGHLMYVFHELFNNAMVALPNGGQITISTGRSPMPTVDVRSEAAQQSIEIEIADSGEGVLPEDKDRIFRPYFTNRSSGIGLGLAIAKEIIETHGGSIKEAGTFGRGARFVVVLPAMSTAGGEVDGQDTRDRRRTSAG